MTTDNKSLIDFYMDIFNKEEDKKAKENLIKVDNQNKNISNMEFIEDLNDFKF